MIWLDYLAMLKFDCVRAKTYDATVIVFRTHKLRAYPSAEQQSRMLRWSDSLRWLWNNAHAERVAKYEFGYKSPHAFDQINGLKALRKSLLWLKDVPYNVSSRRLIELDYAWQMFLSGITRGMPGFKRSKTSEDISIVEPNSSQFSFGGKNRNGFVDFPKLGRVRIVLHKQISGKAKNCSLIREGREWYVCVVCEISVDDCPGSKPRSVVGIDRGAVNVVADSNGRIVPSPKPELNKIRVLCRSVSRSVVGSKNRIKKIDKLRKLRLKIQRRKSHLLHCESKQYAENQSIVVVEDLKIQNMVRSAKGSVEIPGTRVSQKSGLNRSILSSGIGRFLYCLRYKSQVTGCKIIEVHAAYSSQECSACGHTAKENRRSQSDFSCISCGHHEHADVNAAKVILSRGMRGSEVCGGDVVTRPMKQKLRVARRATRIGNEATVVPLSSG